MSSGSTVAADLELRSAVPGDLERILDLMRVSLGEGKIPRSREYWSWKHVQNPFGESPTLLAFAGDQLVGLRVFMRWSWHAAGTDVPAVRAVDTATHPDWQGKGIFSRLTRALLETMRKEGVAFVFNTPNEKSRPGYLKMGWVDVGRTSLRLRPVVSGAWLNAASGSRSHAGAAADPTGGPGSAARDLLADTGLARFCSALPALAGRFSTRITPAYLRWRYVEIPGFDYRAEWKLDGEEGAAVIFRLKERGNLSELRLCEVLVGRGARSQKVARGLLRSVLRRSGCHYLSAMCAPGVPAHRVLLRSGFLPAPRLGPVMTVRLLSGANGGPDPLRRSAWQLSIGDLELF
jgi:GNAT superfamily N-acetyltransferase